MLVQFGWAILRFAILLGFLGADFFLIYLFIAAVKDKEILPAMGCVFFGLLFFGLTFLNLGWLTGW